jgi:hypothetical protein
MVGACLMSAAPTQAAPAAETPAVFVAPSHLTFNISDLWNPAQSTITVSDRTPNKDFRVSQSAYAWGSLAGDSFQTAYTTLTTCTGCIIVRIVSKGNALLGGGPAAANRTVQTPTGGGTPYTKACTIAIEKEYWSTHLDWRERQRMLTHEMGHCLGYMHANPDYNTCELSIEAGVGCAAGTRYTPSDWDYSEQYHTY